MRSASQRKPNRAAAICKCQLAAARGESFSYEYLGGLASSQSELNDVMTVMQGTFEGPRCICSTGVYLAGRWVPDYGFWMEEGEEGATF